jgi:hypothetical protein
MVTTPAKPGQPVQPPLYYKEQVNIAGDTYITTVWEPSYEERMTIAAGGMIEVVMKAKNPPPFFLGAIVTQDMDDAVARAEGEIEQARSEALRRAGAGPGDQAGTGGTPPGGEGAGEDGALGADRTVPTAKGET